MPMPPARKGTWAGLLAAIALLAVLLGGCDAWFAPLARPEPPAPADPAWAPQVVRLAVSWAALPLAEELRAAYTGYRSGVSIEILPMVSEQALGLAAAGQVDLAIVSAKDEGTLRAQAPGLAWRHLARDGLAIVVHRDRPLSQIREQALADLYAGQVADWSALGAGPGMPEFAVQSADTTARQVFDAALMAGRVLSTAALLLPHDEAVLAYVAGHPSAIGYVSAAYLGRDERVKVVALEGLQPSRAQLEVGGYPLAYELFLAQAPGAGEEAARIEAFALGRLGRELIARRYGLPH